MWLSFLTVALLSTPTTNSLGAPVWPPEYGLFCIPSIKTPFTKLTLASSDSHLKEVDFTPDQLDTKTFPGFLCATVASVNGNQGEVRDTLLIERTYSSYEKQRYQKDQPAPRRVNQDGVPYYEIQATFRSAEDSIQYAQISVLLTDWQMDRNISRDPKGPHWYIKVTDVKYRKLDNALRTFPTRTSVSYDGQAVATHFAQSQGRRVTCRPHRVTGCTEAIRADFDPQTFVLVARDEAKPLTPWAGVLLCDGLTPDDAQIALAMPLSTGTEWYLVDRAGPFEPHKAPPFVVEPERLAPSYQVCREPQWKTSLAKGVIFGIHTAWVDGRWTTATDKDPRQDSLMAGHGVHLLSIRDGWGVARPVNTNDVLLLPLRDLFLPSEALRLSDDEYAALEFPTTDFKSCGKAVRGEWRKLEIQTTAEIMLGDKTESWLPVPAQTELLILCDDGVNATYAAPGDTCTPLRGGPNDGKIRYIALYAGQELLIPENNLPKTSGARFDLYRKFIPGGDLDKLTSAPRPKDVKLDCGVTATSARHLFELGIAGIAGTPKGRGFGLDARYVRAPDAGWGYSLGTFLGVDSISAVIAPEAFARRLFWRSGTSPSDVEATLALGGRLSFYVNKSGGLGLDAIARVELLWPHLPVPLRIGAGLLAGYGSTFAPYGGPRIAADLTLGIQLVEF